ncbi:hypothetical protein PVAND_016539 [Polypedilum vanderplanki]|uniref:Major facilitator superfamily (MFS) profile domain-containing protein n=1 Tax=Polypedilum vanderplanki TaxID=319348 RepID=A0A9J6BGG9_POLVA|nr:hypothetical protein PVAND_016539 [Polypedilum vanderplanki]
MLSFNSPQKTSLEEKKTLREAVTDDLIVKGSSCSSYLLLLSIACFITNAVFYAHTLFDTFALTTSQSFYCDIPELSAAKWSADQIRNVTQASDDGCNIYAFNYKKIAKMSFNDAIDYIIGGDEPEVKTCDQIGGKFIYDAGEEKNYATEWNLVCDKEAIASKLSLALYTGCIFGGILLGIVGDIFGRKFVFNIAICPLIVAAFVTSYAQTTTMYFISRFIVGFCGFGISNTFFVLLIENCERQYREVLAVVYNMAYAFGLFGLSAIVGVTSGIRVTEIILAVISVALIVFCKFISESPRFLINRNKHEKAFESLHGVQPDIKEYLSDNHNYDNNIKCHLKKFTSITAFASVMLYIFWFFAFNYSDMNITLLLSNIPNRAKVYATYDLIGYCISIPLLMWMSRKRLMSITLITFGSLMILTAALPPDDTSMTQLMLNICRCFGNPIIVVLSLHILEAFPTAVRNTSYGAVSSIGYIVTLYAVDIVDAFTTLQDKYQLPSLMTLFGLLSIFICSIAYLMPETKGKKWKTIDNEKEDDSKNDESSCHDNTIKSIMFSGILFLVVVFLLLVNYLMM